MKIVKFFVMKVMHVFYFFKAKFFFGSSGITKDLYEFILRALPLNSLVLEFGSGEISTKKLSKLHNVYSIEHDVNYLDLYDSTYIYAPIKNGWYDDVPIRQANIPSFVDLILIDGPNGHIGRSGILKFLDLIPDTANLIIDDTNRLSEFNLALDLHNLLGGELKTFKNFIVISFKNNYLKNDLENLLN
jgi:hypothetical protein